MGSFIGRPVQSVSYFASSPSPDSKREQTPSFHFMGFGAGLPPTTWAGLGQPTAAGAHRLVGPTGRLGPGCATYRARDVAPSNLISHL